MSKVTLSYFSPSRLALAKEIKNHPELIRLLGNHPAAEFEVKLAEIATYCEVILDGDYSPHDLDGLCDLLVRKLKQKLSGIILLN